MSGFRQQIWGFFRELKSDLSEEIAAVEYSGDIWVMAGLNKLVKGLGCPWATWLWLYVDQSKAETHGFSWATWWRACLHQLSPQTVIILLPIAVGWMMSPVRTHLRSVTVTSKFKIVNWMAGGIFVCQLKAVYAYVKEKNTQNTVPDCKC